MFENLLVERSGAVAVLTIRRPQVLNALNHATLVELGLAIDHVRLDADVRALVLTGSGTRAFAAGADIQEIASIPRDQARAYAERGQRVFDAIDQLDKPSIAAVNGVALGGGCELAMACTLRIAAETARFGQPEIDLGLVPGFAGSQRLPRLIGRGPALELLLTGQSISALEAWRLGLVNRVVPGADLLTAALDLAGQLSRKPPVAVRQLLQLVSRGLNGSLGDGQRLEAEAFGLVAVSEDGREGTRAFLEKRAPVFTGR